MNARKSLPLTFWFAIGWSAVMSLGLVLNASANASNAQDLELVLRLHERVSMETLAQDVTDPASPRYGKFYTPDEIRQVAGPSDFDYQQTLASVQAHGLRVISADKTHLFLTVAGSQADVEKTFSTTIQYDGSGGAHHHAIQQTVIPHDLPLVHSVIGIDNTRSSHPLSRALAPPRHVINGDAIGDPDAGLQPDVIQSTYGFNPLYKSGLTGKGQHIAIATYSMFETMDPPQYWGAKDVQPTPQMDVVLFNGTSDIDDDAESETELDAEFSGMIAPGAVIHVFPSSHNDDSGEVQLFTAILDDNRAKVANYSWGDCEFDVDQQHFEDMNQVFARAVAQGVNIMVASGDSGSYGCPTDDDSDGTPHVRATPTPGAVNADWPAANPYVVAAGGTSVDSADDNGNVKEEAWNSSGGGVSVVFPQPSWQKGLVGSFTMRAFPDVAFDADPNTGEVALVHYENQLSWLQFGGTSIAGPQWSGFLALVGEARGAKGALGFLNPILYGLSAQQKAQALHDVTKGSNGAYNAGPGWDATTGWGSMNASELLAILATH